MGGASQTYPQAGVEEHNMATIKLDQLNEVTEVVAQEAADVKGGGGWGMAQYHYGFEGTSR